MFTKKTITAALAVFVGAAGLSISTPARAYALSGTCSVVYTNNNAATIPDGNSAGTGWLAIAVADLPLAATIADYNLRVDITHEWDGDVDISTWNGVGSLSPQAVSNDNGSDGANYTNTLFDSQAATSITAGAAPFTGAYQPETGFSNFDGLIANRTYWLFVADDYAGFVGTVNSWSVELVVAGCDSDGDGLRDHEDMCKNIAASTPSGCPLASRTLTISYAFGAYRGALGSGTQPCRTNMKVIVWKVRSGPDLKVGLTSTNATGHYALARSRSHGKFYAKTGAKVLTDIAACQKATSATRSL